VIRAQQGAIPPGCCSVKLLARAMMRSPLFTHRRIGHRRVHCRIDETKEFACKAAAGSSST